MNKIWKAIPRLAENSKPPLDVIHSHFSCLNLQKKNEQMQILSKNVYVYEAFNIFWEKTDFQRHIRDPCNI